MRSCGLAVVRAMHGACQLKQSKTNLSEHRNREFLNNKILKGPRIQFVDLPGALSAKGLTFAATTSHLNEAYTTEPLTVVSTREDSGTHCHFQPSP